MIALFPQVGKFPLEVEGFQAISRQLEPRLAHTRTHKLNNWNALVADLKAQFLAGNRDFYSWDEMTKAAEMKFLMDCQLEPGAIVELCCGYSYWVRRVLKPIDVGIDLFPSQGAYARSIHTLANEQQFADHTYHCLLSADVTQPLPIGDQQVANIISFCAFEHIPSARYDALFGQIFRLLKPGGRFVFSVQSLWCYQTFYALFRPDLVQSLRQKAQVADLFDWDYWRNLLEAYGFKIRQARACIDRERSQLYALSFAPSGFGSNPLVRHYSEWMRGGDASFFEQALAWLCAWVEPPQADLYLFEVEK